METTQPGVRDATETGEAATQTPTGRIEAVSEEGRALLRQGVAALAGVCDGAIVRDRTGFNAADSALGKWLAALPPQEWATPHAAMAYTILGKYARQLRAHGIDLAALAGTEGLMKAGAAGAERSTKVGATSAPGRWSSPGRAPQSSVPPRSSFSIEVIEIEGAPEEVTSGHATNGVSSKAVRVIRVRFPFSSDALGAIRAIKGRQWDPPSRAWDVPYIPSSVEALMQFVERFASDTPDGALTGEGAAQAAQDATSAGVAGVSERSERARLVHLLQSIRQAMNEEGVCDPPEKKIEPVRIVLEAAANADPNANGDPNAESGEAGGTRDAGGREARQDVLIYFPYDAALWDAVRNLPGSQRDPIREAAEARGIKCFRVPLSVVTLRPLAELAGARGVPLPPDLVTSMEEITACYNWNLAHSRAIEPDGDWEQEEHAESTVSGPQGSPDRAGLLRQLDQGYEGKAAVQAERARRAALLRPLRPFQRVGVEYLVRNRRALLADKMGLGKTAEALVAARILRVRKLLVVCPTTVKHNWAREAARWSPGWSTVVVEDGKHSDWNADVAIINYELVVKHIGRLKRLGFDGIIADECHRLKEKKTKWTQALNELVRIAPSGSAAASTPGHVPFTSHTHGIPVRFALTGTPIPNRPSELLPILEFLGRAEDFGGGWHFLSRFTGARETPWGWDFSGATNLGELGELLRGVCMVHRDTADVVDHLPRFNRIVLQVDVSNRREYAAAHADILKYLRERMEEDRAFNAQIAHLPAIEQERLRLERGRDAVERARRAEMLVKLETLKGICERGKLAAVKEWVDDFMQGNQGGVDSQGARTGQDKLIIFCVHRDVQEALIRLYPEALHIFADDSARARESATQEFQNNSDKRLLLASAAAKEGVTLTAASYVLFAGLWWRPSDHDQAEHRIYRINDLHEGTAYYMVGRDTVDERTMELLESKRAISQEVLGGHQSYKGNQGDQHPAGEDLTARDGELFARRSGEGDSVFDDLVSALVKEAKAEVPGGRRTRAQAGAQ